MERVLLSQSMLVTSIIGFMVSSIFTYSGRLNLSIGFASCLVFVMMFVASFITMTPTAKDLDQLEKAAK